MKKWPEGMIVPESVAQFLESVGRDDPVFEIKRNECALLVIDMQNDFILPGAPLEGGNVWRSSRKLPNW